MGFCRYSQGSHSAVNIAGSVQAFITTMDSLKLNMAAVDQVWKTLFGVQALAICSALTRYLLDMQIFPLMSDLLTNLNKVRLLRANYQCCISQYIFET